MDERKIFQKKNLTNTWSRSVTNRLDRISSLRRIYPTAFSRRPALSLGINIGNIAKINLSQSNFKIKGKKGKGNTKKSPIFDLTSIVREASEHNKAYWKVELGKIVKEFGLSSLSDELKKMAKSLGIKK